MRSAFNYQLEDTKHSPLIVFYEVTRACDLACKHCRACAQPDPHPNELSTDESKNLIKQLSTFPKKPILVITGGDPLKRDDIFELIRYAREDCQLEVSFVPSATPLLNVAALKKLQKAGITRLGLSIDGADMQTHDEQRGVPGTFSHAIDMLKVARKLGIQTQINTTITKANVNQIKQMADVFEPLDIALWSVFFLVPVGRGINDNKIAPSQYRDVFTELWHQAQIKPFAIKTTEAPFYRRFVLQNNGNFAAPSKSPKRKIETEKEGRPSFHPNKEDAPKHFAPEHHARSASKAPLGLNDGKGVMFVSHTGDVQPSGFLPSKCGNSRKESVVDIYQKHDTFIKLRRPELLKGKCGYCVYRGLCGGSRARAKAMTGDMLAPEPDCTFIPPAWLDHVNQKRISRNSSLDNHITVSSVVNVDLRNDNACTSQQSKKDDCDCK